MLYPRRERSGLGLPFDSLGLVSREEDGGIGVITTTDWVEDMEFLLAAVFVSGFLCI